MISANDTMQELDTVNRVEVIDAAGRAYVKYGVHSLKLMLQDNGKTLKIFIENDPDTEPTS